MSDRFAATKPIMPMLSESPIQSAFFFVVDMGSGGPLLHVAKLMGVDGGELPGSAVQFHRASYELPVASTHCEPWGQQANCEPGQQTALGSGQQPTPEGLKPLGQHVELSEGQRVSFHVE